jgi:Zn-dependent metalloprotease
MKYYNKVLSFALASSLMMTPMSFANEATETKEATEVTVDTAAGFTVFNTEETANFIKINDSIVKEPTIEGVREFFNENQAFFQIQNPELELSEISTFTDMQGNTHVKVQQQFNELPVLGKEYIVHFNKDNEIYAANGHLDLSVYDKADKGISRDTKIDGDLAISIARKEIMADSYTDNQEATMYLYENDENYLPIYEVEIATVAPLGEWNVKVDAQTGEVLSASNKLETIQYEGHGAGVDHKLKTLNLDKRDDGKYYLYDDTRNGVVVKTFDMKHNNDEYALPGELIWDEDSVLYGDDKRAAVDAHKYAGFVIDYYKDNFGRNSINNEGMDIVSSVHFDKNYVNAFWWNDQMTYGDGDGVEALALSGALDIVGHEMTHGVTEYTANLVYENQPGALNESMSDVFGTFIEMEYQPEKADYLCGEAV